MVKWGGKENTTLLKCIVPSSGTLNFSGIVGEHFYGDYNSPYSAVPIGFQYAHQVAANTWDNGPNSTAPYAMSEFYGLAKTCFIFDTKVLMGDGKLMNIQDIKVGDLVETIDGVCSVLEVLSHTKNSELFSINDNNFFVTDNHPFMTKDGWKSLNISNITNKDYLEDIPLQVGDFIQTTKGWTEINKIQGQENSNVDRVYNIKVNEKESYFANNYLVHNKCFVGDTLITMSDGTYKPIEEINIGDKVFTQLGNEEVLEIFSPVHDNILEYTFSDGTKTKNTSDHPYYVVDKGWCSNVPELTNERYEIVTNEFVCGDICVDDNDEQIELVNIEELGGEFQTYTFSTNSKTYYANTILVHSEI